MPTRVYPFIDIAVLDSVRHHFVAGDAVVILTVELDTVIWANGAGAALLGYEDIEEVRGAASNLGLASRRQISGTPGFPAIGANRSLLVRVTQRLSSHAVGFLASEVVLPGGPRAIMLVAPDFDAEKRSPQQIGARVIHGIAEAGHHAALIDGSGGVIAASPGFAAVGPESDELADLAADVQVEADRLIKRLVRIDDMAYPVGIARLSDDPERHLVIVVDDPQPLPSAVRETPNLPPEPTPQPHPVRSGPPRTPQTVHAQHQPHDSDTWYFGDVPAPPPKPTAAAERIAEPVPHVSRDTAETEPSEFEPVAIDARGYDEVDDPHASSVELADEPEPEVAALLPVEDEAWQSVEEMRAAPDVLDEPVPAAVDAPLLPANDDIAYDPAVGFDDFPDLPELPPLPPMPDLPAFAGVDEDEPSRAGDDEDAVQDDAVFRPDFRSGPVRFVWRTDALGRFSTLSDEFARSVGAAAADVVGRRFREIANAFGLDPDGEIADLLEHRDTWSGRSVMWPIEGTDLKVPVDLAALPVYARDRSFEGFRGFGVVRIGDAVIDEDAIGLTLAKRGIAAVVAEAPAERHDPFAGETPALAVDVTPDRRVADKVIRLAEHRGGGDRGLTPNETIAFREIGARLKDADTELRTRPGGETIPANDETDAFERRLYSDDLPDPAESDDGRDELARDPDGDGLIEDHLDPSEPEPDEAVAPFLDRSEGQYEGEDASEDDSLEDQSQTDRDTPVAQDSDGETLDEEAVPRSVDTSILERLPVPVLIHSGDRLHFANQEFLELTGYVSLLELDQAGGLDALFVDDEDSIGRDPEDHRRRLRTRNGEEFPVDARLQSVPWKGGKALLLALRTAAPSLLPAATAEELVELESRVTEMSTILDTATDGIVIIGNDNTIRSISRPAEALFGFDTTEVAGKAFVSLFAVESQRAARDYLNGLSDNGVASVLNDGREVIGREAQGRFIPLFMTIGRLPGAKGYCAVLRDITQWKRAEEELTQARAEAERASSQKTEFLARISHEIRTPLNAIIGFSELMIDEKFGPIVNDRYRDYLRDINRSGNHVLDLVNDLLDISKIEAGEQEMSYEAVALNETLAETVAMMQPQANRNRVIIRSSFASRLPDVVADLRSIRQIALNLLSNAVRYTQAGGQVIVSTSYEPTGDVVLRVRDTGVGMSQGEIEQALKPFKQINALKRPRGDGTGLGLPLTKAMVEANRARFAISSAPSEGTMVEIVFPSQRVLAG